MIDWENLIVHEPFLIQKLSNPTLDDILLTPHIFPKFPLHSQTVERAVKLVSSAAAQVVGGDRRHGHILSILKARETRKPANSKKDYEYMPLE